MKRRPGSRLLFALILGWGGPSQAADLSEQGTNHDIAINGTIEIADVARVDALLHLSRANGAAANVRLNSNGGNLEAAMAIGRLLRKADSRVFVFPPDRCASACVFIVAGAVERYVMGEVIIHRPYLMEDLPGAGGYDQNYKHMQTTVRTYLAEMNIPADLGDRMFAIPPEAGEQLSESELHRYMLNQEDPAHEQQIAAAQAQRLGISLTEQRRRAAQGEAMCPPLTPLDDGGTSKFNGDLRIECEQALMSGQNAVTVQREMGIVMQNRAVLLNLQESYWFACIDKFLKLGGAGCPLQ
jgi:hypothetical protein